MPQNHSQGILSNFDFTVGKYEKLCKAISSSKYVSITLADYLGNKSDGNNTAYIIMRHDIDRNPERALDIAQVEHKYGIRATYYFRDQKSTYKPYIMDKIAAYGHEIGYHYETIDKSKGDLKLAEGLFVRELDHFRTRYDVKTVCAHGNPLTKFDNKDIWKIIKWLDYRLLGEAFLSLDYTRFAYFSDSGRTWLNSKSQKMPGKDSIMTSFGQYRPQKTEDVIAIIRSEKLPNICILTHPERWCNEIVGFSSRYLLDLSFRWGKSAIFAYRQVVNQHG
jgi:hypothetical protein